MKTVTTMILALVLFTSLIFAQSAALYIENERIEDDLFKFEISIQRTAAWPG